MATPAEEAEQRGLRRKDMGDSSGAVRNFTAAVRLTDPARPDGARARRAMLLGESLAVAGDYDEAADWYTASLAEPIAEDVVRLNTWRLLSALRLRQGRIVDSRAALDEALRLTDRCPPDDLVHLDALLQAALVVEAEVGFGEGTPASVADLAGKYAARSDVAGTRGHGYSRLLLARAAMARHDLGEAIRICEEVIAASCADSALRRLHATALITYGEAHLAATQFAEAMQAYRDCAQFAAPTELQTFLVQARLGIAATHRATGASLAGHRELQGLAKTVKLDNQAAPLQVKYLLTLGLSHISLAADADDTTRRTELSTARSILRRAEFLQTRTEGTDRLGIQIANALAHVQRALGRPRQSIRTLEDARGLVDSPTIAATDRGDFLSGVATTYLHEAADPAELDKATTWFLHARETFTTWYDLARTDQNLAVIDKRRADLAAEHGDADDESRHLTAVIDRLVPALLAKYAVRYTLSSQRLRREWNAQQARGLDIAMACALRLHQLGRPGGAAAAEWARLVADLVLVSRVQGVLNPDSAPGDDPDLDDRRRAHAGPFASDDPNGVTPEVADILGLGDASSRLAPSPRLMAPDGRVALARYFARAIELYGDPHGLEPRRLYRQGSMMRL